MEGSRLAALGSPPPSNGTKRARIGKASGYTHRSFRPDAVGYMYVDTAMHRPAVTHPDTCRDKKKQPRRTALPQPAGRFPRWWQVLGSNLSEPTQAEPTVLQNSPACPLYIAIDLRK